VAPSAYKSDLAFPRGRDYCSGGGVALRANIGHAERLKKSRDNQSNFTLTLP